MTSDSDDLEQQLRQNLKLRRELKAEVAKAAGIAYRLGWVLYWASLVCIGFWCAYVLLRLQIEGLPRTGGEVTLFDGVFLVAFFVVPALLIYGLGRVFRYVLSGG